MRRRVSQCLLVTLASAGLVLAAGQSPPDPLPEGEGKMILETACTTCHSLKEVTKFKGYYTRDDWSDVVRTMMANGAKLKDSEVPVLVDYLTKNFGPPPPPPPPAASAAPQ